MNKPDITIIVPVYNVEAYLEECLNSLLSQTFENIEIVCVNDGSTDKSSDILEEYSRRDGRIRVITKQNTGYGDSLNRGLDAAAGEYVGIVESDDFVKPEMFETLFNIAKKEDCDLVKCDFFNYFSKEHRSEKADKYEQAYINRVIKPLEEKKIFLLQPAVWSALYRKSFLDKNNIRFLPTKGASYQDVSFAFKCYAKADRVFFFDEALLYYRQDNASSSVKNKDKVFCIIDELQEMERFLLSDKTLHKELVHVLGYLKFGACHWNMKRVDGKYRKEFAEFMSDELKKDFNRNGIDTTLFEPYQLKEYFTAKDYPIKYLRMVERKLFLRKLSAFRKKIVSVRRRNNKLKISVFNIQIVGEV